MESASFLNIDTLFFNVYCVAVHKPSDPICEEVSGYGSLVWTLPVTSSPTPNLHPHQASSNGKNL
jgi:hypothetical protein